MDSSNREFCREIQIEMNSFPYVTVIDIFISKKNLQKSRKQNPSLLIEFNSTQRKRVNGQVHMKVVFDLSSFSYFLLK